MCATRVLEVTLAGVISNYFLRKSTCSKYYRKLAINEAVVYQKIQQLIDYNEHASHNNSYSVIRPVLANQAVA
jgi:hypothetical protein